MNAPQDPASLRLLPKICAGSISEGTLRNEDLIPALRLELRSLAPSEEAKIPEAEEQDSEEGTEEVSELMDALGALAPEGLYFGANEGDGAAIGFWAVPGYEVDTLVPEIEELQKESKRAWEEAIEKAGALDSEYHIKRSQEDFETCKEALEDGDTERALHYANGAWERAASIRGTSSDSPEWKAYEICARWNSYFQ